MQNKHTNVTFPSHQYEAFCLSSGYGNKCLVVDIGTLLFLLLFALLLGAVQTHSLGQMRPPGSSGVLEKDSC